MPACPCDLSRSTAGGFYLTNVLMPLDHGDLVASDVLTMILSLLGAILLILGHSASSVRLGPSFVLFKSRITRFGRACDFVKICHVFPDEG